MSVSTGFAWERHRFKDLLDLGRRARDGHGANTTVTKQEGENLLTLLAEAVQYREAHKHSQELRARAEGNMRDLRDRLAEKAVTLSEMADNTDAGGRGRLSGKAEGVDLAISFVEEYLRGY